MPTANRELDLLQAAIRGERTALLKLLSRSRRELCERLARRVPASLRGTLDADDLVQSTHIEVFQRIGEFEARDAGAFDRWVNTIALGKLRDALRRHRAAKRGAGRPVIRADRANSSDSMVALFERVAGPGQTPSRVAAREEVVTLMQQAVRQLPSAYRSLVRRIYIDGESVTAIAAELGRTEGAIRVACHKARCRLRDILGDQSRFFSKPR